MTIAMSRLSCQGKNTLNGRKERGNRELVVANAEGQAGASRTSSGISDCLEGAALPGSLDDVPGVVKAISA